MRAPLNYFEIIRSFFSENYESPSFTVKGTSLTVIVNNRTAVFLCEENRLFYIEDGSEPREYSSTNERDFRVNLKFICREFIFQRRRKYGSNAAL